MHADEFTSNALIVAGVDHPGRAIASRVYRDLVALHGHESLCNSYGLDHDTYWLDVVGQARLHGDVDGAGNLT